MRNRAPQGYSSPTYIANPNSSSQNGTLKIILPKNDLSVNKNKRFPISPEIDKSPSQSQIQIVFQIKVLVRPCCQLSTSA